jgi:hypothetical protein
MASIATVGVATAATLHVARDGSAPYTVIQDAVHAAASGDTVRIGPGRYNEGQIVETQGWTEFVRVLVTQEELTIIGSGEETIIGPDEPWSPDDWWNKGIVGGPYFGNDLLRVQDLCVENVGNGIEGANAPVMIVQGCTFRDNYQPIFCFNNSATVVDCVFEGQTHSANQLTHIAGESLTVRDCVFISADEQDGIQKGLVAQNIGQVIVENCEFVDGDVGLYLLGIDAVTVSFCSFIGQSINGSRMAFSDDCRVSDSEFRDLAIALRVEGGDLQFIGDHLTISDVAEVSVEFPSFIGDISINNSVLARGEHHTIRQGWPCTPSREDLPVFDFTDNDWGTTEADSIAAWIHTCDFVIDYIPFVGQPVATEARSWSRVKAMFDAGDDER